MALYLVLSVDTVCQFYKSITAIMKSQPLKVEKPFWEVQFNPGDYLVFGRETKGLPESLIEDQIEKIEAKK